MSPFFLVKRSSLFIELDTCNNHKHKDKRETRDKSDKVIGKKKNEEEQ
jgi:hypothetical protein